MRRLPILSALLAASLLGAFFLPWFVIFGEHASGFALARLGDIFSALWVLPGLATITLALHLASRPSPAAALATGLAPFVLSAWVFIKLRASDDPDALEKAWKVACQLAAPGAWITFALGAALVVSAALTWRTQRASAQG